MDPLITVLLITLTLVVVIIYGVTLIFLKGLIEQVISLLKTLDQKVIEIEGEMKPILRDLDETLRNLRPLTEELGRKGENIGTMIDNLERVSDDAKATTGAIRNGIVPVAHALKGIFAGIADGIKVFSNEAGKRDKFIR